MLSWLMSVMRRGGLLAVVVLLSAGMLGLHLHHDHPAADTTTLGHDHAGHDHHDDHDGHDHPDGEGLDDDDRGTLVLHLHAVDAMTLPERPLLGTDGSAVLLDRRIPTVAQPDGLVIGVDPPPVRTAA